MKLPQHVSQSVKRRNPELYPVGAVVPNRPKQPALRPLVRGQQEPAAGAGSVRISVCFIVLRRRLLDRFDNENYALKPLKDAIADRLGIDDNDERISWSCHQIKTDGEQGVIVKIEAIMKGTP